MAGIRAIFIKIRKSISIPMDNNGTLIIENSVSSAIFHIKQGQAFNPQFFLNKSV
jgi:hypothetical protein